MRAGKANISDSYIIFNQRRSLFIRCRHSTVKRGVHIIIVCDPTRTRKLLLNQKEQVFI